jgi:alkylation response protein AidB-like acyl-CoA dehydrogenase
MEFDLSAQQKQKVEMVHRVLAEEFVPKVVKTDRERSLDKEHTQKIIKRLLPLGVISGHIPGKYGGLAEEDTDHIVQGLIMEELAWAWPSLSEIVITQSMVAERIRSIGTEKQIVKFLSPLARGERMFCTGNSEPEYGSDAAGYKVGAVLDNDHYVVNGTKMWSTAAMYADSCLLLAQTDPTKGPKGLRHFIVEKEVSPFGVEEIFLAAVRNEGISYLHFENCKVPRENLLGGEAGVSYKKQLMAWGLVRVYVAFQSIGIARRAAEAAVAYALDRKQFGKPLASFQMIQDMIVDIHTEIDAARLLALRGAYLLNKKVRCAKECSMAKVFGTRAGIHVTDKVVEIFGGRGLIEDSIPEVCYREARAFTIPDGTLNINKLVAGKEILGISAVR